MERTDRSHLTWFGLALAGTWVFAMLLPVGQWACLAGATLIAGALGLLLGTVLIYFFSR